MVWSHAENEIASPRFSVDGQLIVLASRVHWPDGVEAEGLPDSFYKELESRKQRDPHFADPVVRLLDLKGKLTCEVRWGLNPSISRDNQSIAFSRQKKAITGLRELAATQEWLAAEPRSQEYESPEYLQPRRKVLPCCRAWRRPRALHAVRNEQWPEIIHFHQAGGGPRDGVGSGLQAVCRGCDPVG